MILRLKDMSTMELSSVAIMAKLEIDPRAPFSADEIKKKARDFDEWGCRFIEVNVLCRDDCACTPELVRKLKVDALKALFEYNEERKTNPATAPFSALGITIPLEESKSAEEPLLFAVNASTPEDIQLFCENGADIIIDPNALRTEGAAEMVAEKRCIVILSFDQEIEVDEKNEKDPTAVITEFFYERLNACYQAKIDKKRIVIDPMLSLKCSMEFRLKMVGRLKSLSSFGLPISYEVPRFSLDGEDNMTFNSDVSAAVAIFITKEGVNIIRTRTVKEIAMSIDTWLALSDSARPFKLSMAVKAKFKQIAKNRKQRKLEKASPDAKDEQ